MVATSTKLPIGWEQKKLGEIATVIMGQSPQSKFYNTRQIGIPLVQGNADVVDRKTVARIYTSSITKKALKGDVLISVRAPVGAVSISIFDCCLGRGMAAIRYENNYLYHYLVNFEQSWGNLSRGSTFDSINSTELKDLEVTLPKTPQEQVSIAAILSDADTLIQKVETLIAKKQNVKKAVMQQLLTGKRRLPGFKGEWQLHRMGTLGTFSKGQGIRKSDVLPSGLPCIRYGEIYTLHNDYIKQYASFISPEVATQSKRLKKGDLLFAGSGETSEEIGKCVAYLDEDEAYAGGDIVILSPYDSDSKFLSYLMNSASIVAQKSRMGQGDAVVHISAKALQKIEVTIPPTTKEQAAIAAVLSDMDAEIDKLNRQLEKYRLIKTGMMQQLLTGKIRIYGSKK